MNIYYNENDPFAAAWLRNLIAAGHLPPGDVDTRSIVDVRPDDLSGYAQCHFFAGIGGWPYALRLAGWPDDREVWTGSCPCQPFSAAGKRKGEADERHLWPEFRRLIAERRPAVVFGEQVASKDGRTWLVGVRADLEALGYAVGAADLGAASIGAPHIRQRLWWVADADGGRSGARRSDDAEMLGVPETQREPEQRAALSWRSSADGRLGDSDDTGPQGRNSRRDGADERTPWSASVAIPCADGKTRRIEPRIQPLAHGVPNRVGRLRGYGNAIVPQVAAEFIEVYRSVTA